MAMTTLSTTIDGNNAGRVDVVVRLLSESSHSQVRGMLDSGCVSINSTIILSGATTVVVGDLVSIRFDPTQGYREKKKCWDDRTFTVSFEDDHLIVVDKSAGTLTVPTARNERNTLVDRVSIYLGHSRSKREACVVHRLDRDLSGLVIFGKHKQVATRLIEQFKQQKPSRVYAAIVAGVVSTDKGSFHSHLATGKSLERYVTRPSPTTELAITHYRVIRRMPDATLVEVTLETGKRNQIRVQFANAEHPVLGDPRYKTELAMHPRWIRKRIALHAKSLGFEHPISGDAMQIESPLPSAIEKFLAGSR